MSFPLSLFEKHITADIVNKGLNYFSLDHVENLACDGQSWEADVHGTQTYTVKIDIMNGEVTGWFCDCPYDWGPICKHVAAVMFAIREETLKEVIAPKTVSKSGKLKLRQVEKPKETDPLEEIIAKLNADEMRSLLTYFSKRDNNVKTHLLSKYSNLISVNTSGHIKKLVKSIINSYSSGRHGFIEYQDANRLGGYLYRLVEDSDGSDPLGTVDLCEEVIVQLAETVKHADDSSGSIGEAVYAAFEKLEYLTKEENNTPAEVVSYIFKMALKHGRNLEYRNYGIDGFQDLAFAAVRNHQQADQLIEMLDDFILEKSKEKYGMYAVESAAHLKYRLIKEWQSAKEADRFLQTNLHYNNFRETALGKALAAERYDEVKRLAEDGIRQDMEKAPGYARQWKEWLLRLAEVTGDTDTLVSMTEQEFLESGHMEKYRKLKELIPAEKFSKKIELYIKHFKNRSNRFGGRYKYFNHQVASILEEENRLSELMALLEEAPSLHLLDQYFKLLMKDNQTTFIRLYDQLIRDKMEVTSDRSGYQECCRYLNKLTKIGGVKNAQSIAGEWKATYPRRRAMLEEIQKIGL